MTHAYDSRLAKRTRNLTFAAILGAGWLVLTLNATGADAGVQAAVPPSVQQKPGDLLSGVTRAICYSGYRHGQRPNRDEPQLNPTESQILEDLRILAQDGRFALLRTYDAKVNSETLLRVIKQHKLKLKVLLGAWLHAEITNTNCPWLKTPHPPEVLEANKKENANEVEQAIRLARLYPGIVAAVSVGNESLVSWNDHLVAVDSVIRYVRHVKASISQPVTVADNYDWWAKQGAALAKEVDFVSIHTYPAWEGKTIEEALAFTIANVEAVRAALPQSSIAITEAGWPDIASEFGSRASEENQKRYFQDLYAWAERAHITTFFFEAFDEDWKGSPDNPNGAEKHWGLFTIDRKPKLAMREFLRNAKRTQPTPP